MKIKQELALALKDLREEIRYFVDKVKNANIQSERLSVLQNYIGRVEQINHAESDDGYISNADAEFLNDLFNKESIFRWQSEVIKILNRRPLQLTLFSQVVDFIGKEPAKNHAGLPLPDLYYRIADLNKHRGNQERYKHYIELAYDNYHKFENWYLYR